MKDAPHEVKHVVETSELPSLMAPHAPAKLPRTDRCRRHRLLAVFVGLDRQAEGDRAHACESVLDGRVVRQADSRRPRRRRRVLGGETFFRVRAG